MISDNYVLPYMSQNFGKSEKICSKEIERRGERERRGGGAGRIWRRWKRRSSQPSMRMGIPYQVIIWAMA